MRTPFRTRVSLTVLGLILLPGLAGAWRTTLCYGGQSGEKEILRLAISPLETTALILIADEKGLFPANGLDVTLKYYDTGREAVSGLTAGECEVAWAMDYVLAGDVLRGQQLQTIASIAEVDFTWISALRDRGIEKISDLRGKAVGVPMGTNLEFYLGRFLELQGLDWDDIVKIDTQLAETVDGVASGRVDAVVSVSPYVDQVRDRLGDRAIFWRAQCGRMSFSLLISKTEWIRGHSEAIVRLLTALSQAQDYLAAHPSDGRNIVAERVGLTEDEAARIWVEDELVLGLEQALVAAMEDEARWMIAHGLAREQEMPDYTDHIYWQGLARVRLDAVTLVGVERAR